MEASDKKTKAPTPGQKAGLGWLARLLCAACLSVVAVAGPSQPLCTVSCYDEDAGMSQWHVTQMLQDRDGLMWFSTWNGLDRFDGYQFVNFKARAGDGCAMPVDRFRDLRQGDDGQLYCMAEKDWYCFDRTTGVFSPAPASLQARLSQGVKGRGATGALHADLFHTDRYGQRWRVDADGQLFCFDATASGGLWRPYPLDEPLRGVRFSLADRQGNLWLLTTSCVYKLSFSRRPATRLPQERPAQVRCLFSGGDGSYWVCTKEDATVRLFDRDHRLAGYLTASGQLVSSYASFGSAVYCMARQSDGTLWLGTKPDGLFRLRPSDRGYAVEHLSGLLPCNDVYDLKFDAAGRLWVATMGGGICCLPEPGEASPRVVGKDGGFARYPEMDAHRVRHLHFTADGLLLAATTEGLLVGHAQDGSPATMTFRLHQKEAARANSLSSNATMYVLETSRHRLFVCTESGGVSEILSDDLQAASLQFRHYNQTTGLSSDIALSMAEADGQLWIVGSNRLMPLDAQGESVGHFDSHFFHEPCRFSEASPLRLPDGRWLFGLMDGAFAMSPAIARQDDYVPAIVLTAIDRQGARADYAANHLQRVVLGPRERSLTVHFAALDYEEPSAVSYAFRMADEEDWTYVGHNRSASFAGLAPGTYELLIRSTNASGAWVDNTRRLTIVVEPTFWESWYGRLFLLVLAGAVLGTVAYTLLYIARMRRRHREVLEAYLALLGEADTPSQTVVAPPVQPAASPLGASLPPAGPSAVAPPKPAAVVPRMSADDEAFMSRVVAYVEAHLADADANVGDMAEQAASSRSGLNRKMKSIVGVTPADFLREARIKRACQLLRTTDDPVSDIAFRCGFTDPKYFGKCFKASVGASPTEYRTAKAG